MRKKLLAICLAAAMSAGLMGCGSSAGNAGSGKAENGQNVSESTTGQTASADAGTADSAKDSTEGKKILRTAASFAYPSLDVHKEYYGWYTSIYGISEALFRLDETSSAVPCLAEDAVLQDMTWTITLKEGVAFSNGTPLTAAMVIRNLQRTAEVNERFAYMGEYRMEVLDDRTFTITTDKVYPTMKNDLASPEFGMVDLDATEDFDNAPVCTGPFVIDKFNPEGDVTVKKNESYWGGDVKLDGA